MLISAHQQQQVTKKNQKTVSVQMTKKLLHASEMLCISGVTVIPSYLLITVNIFPYYENINYYLLFPNWRQHLLSLVIACQAMDTTLNQDQAKLAIFVLKQGIVC